MLIKEFSSLSVSIYLYIKSYCFLYQANVSSIELYISSFKINWYHIFCDCSIKIFAWKCMENVREIYIFSVHFEIFSKKIDSGPLYSEGYNKLSWNYIFVYIIYLPYGKINYSCWKLFRMVQSACSGSSACRKFISKRMYGHQALRVCYLGKY